MSVVVERGVGTLPDRLLWLLRDTKEQALPKPIAGTWDGCLWHVSGRKVGPNTWMFTATCAPYDAEVLKVVDWHAESDRWCEDVVEEFLGLLDSAAQSWS